MDECKHLNGRMKDICEGNVDLSLPKINKYRASWGLPPLTQESKKSSSTSSPNYGTSKPCSTCNKKKTLPPVTEQIKNFAGAVKDHVKDGMKKASDEEYQRRLSICDGCPFKIQESNRCSKCGCFLEKKAKWNSSSCPIDKW